MFYLGCEVFMGIIALALNEDVLSIKNNTRDYALALKVNNRLRN